ncbi:MAG: NADH-quinone oxidoreductase subunit D [Bacteroidota bacterium]
MEAVKENKDLKTQEYFVNMGPQHPSTHGVLRLMLGLDGEIITSLKPHIGYVHRSIEKMCEYDSYRQIAHLTDRMDYLSSHMSNEAVSLLVENALEIEVSDRVKVIRTIIAELARISSHQLWWAATGMDLGALTAFLYGFRDREMINDIFEETVGARLTMNYNVPGGLMFDIHPNFQKRVKEFIEHFKTKLPEYDQLLSDNVIFRNRTEGIGVIDKETAISYGLSGPTGRASGVECDVRKAHPYSAYDRVEFKSIVLEEGDTFARYKARILEMWESMHIIEQLIDNIPEGDIKAPTKALIKLPKGEFYQRVETARGDFGVYVVSEGGKSPYRLKFRSPSFSNVFVLEEMAKGSKIADLVAMMATLDLVVPDIDR